MADDTTILTKTNGVTVAHDSIVLGVSVRAWVVIILVFTMSINHLMVGVGVMIDAIWYTKDWSRVGTYTQISEPLYGAILLSLGFYFGQKTSKP